MKGDIPYNQDSYSQDGYNQDNQDNYSVTLSHMEFLKLLLSLNRSVSKSICRSFNEGAERRWDFHFSLWMDEKLYELCMDLFLQKIIAKGKTQGSDLHESS